MPRGKPPADLTKVDLPGRLRAVRLNEKRGPKGEALWWCECECGAIVLRSASALASGNTRSCGCLREEMYASQRGQADSAFGRRLRRLMAEQNVSRSDLAARLDVQASQVSRWMCGHVPSWERACAIADALDVGIEEFRENPG